MNERRHLDLFSGICGFAVAARAAGFKTIGFVEKNPELYPTIEHWFPDVPIFGDIHTFGGRGFECDLLTGGFPCQPFSCAGERRGKEDDRYLWPEMLRVIKKTKPDWIVGENVDGLDGLGLDDCISDLEASGYEVAPPLEIPACAIGAPHRRNRIWIIANAINSFASFRQSAGRREWSASEASQIWAPADANGERELQSQGGIQDERGRVIHFSPEIQWQESWPDRLGSLCRMDDGVSRRLDEASHASNAIVPQIAYQIIKAIYEISYSQTQRP